MIKKAVTVALKATVTDPSKWAVLCVQIDWRTSTDTAVKNSPSLSKKLTAEVQSIHYGFCSAASPLVEATFNLRELVEQSYLPQTQALANLIGSLLHQDGYGFLHKENMAFSILSCQPTMLIIFRISLDHSSTSSILALDYWSLKWFGKTFTVVIW